VKSAGWRAAKPAVRVGVSTSVKVPGSETGGNSSWVTRYEVSVYRRVVVREVESVTETGSGKAVKSCPCVNSVGRVNALVGQYSSG
jgi:hypothetical protein